MTDQQELIVLTMIFKPIGFLLLLGAAYPFKILVMRCLPEGRVKRLLLTRVGGNRQPYR